MKELQPIFYRYVYFLYRKQWSRPVYAVLWKSGFLGRLTDGHHFIPYTIAIRMVVNKAVLRL